MFEPSGILKVCDIYLGDACQFNGYEISLNEVKFIKIFLTYEINVTLH
jgi:hypothetical protein